MVRQSNYGGGLWALRIINQEIIKLGLTIDS